MPEPFKPGTTFTKRITRGPNKGDRVRFRVGPSGKPYPIRVLSDVGARSTLRDNPGVKFGRGSRGVGMLLARAGLAKRRRGKRKNSKT